MRSEGSKINIASNKKRSSFSEKFAPILHLFYSLKILLLRLLNETEEWQSVLEAAREREPSW